MPCPLVRTAGQKIDQMIIKTIFEGEKKNILEFTDAGRLFMKSVDRGRKAGPGRKLRGI